MANFNIAWSITAKHEGSNYTKSTADTGNTYNGIVYGSKYGITAKFLIEDWKVKNLTPNFIQNLTSEQAATYAKLQWNRMKGDLMASQEVANLTFDWMYQRPGTAVKLIAKAFKHTDVEVADIINRLKFSDKLLSDINNTNADIAYNTIKEARYIFTTKSKVYRDTTLDVVKSRVLSYKDFPAFSCNIGQVLTQEDICSDGENQDDNNNTFIYIAGVFVLAKIFKII